MSKSSATKKLFNVVVLAGMGAGIAGVACSSSSSSGPTGPTADAATPVDANTPQNDAPGAPVDAPSADACVGWSPCC